MGVRQSLLLQIHRVSVASRDSPQGILEKSLLSILLNLFFVIEGNKCVLPDNITEIRPFPMKQRKR